MPRRIGQGRERAMEWLRTNPDAFQRLVEAIKGGAEGAPAVAAVAEAVA